MKHQQRVRRSHNMINLSPCRSPQPMNGAQLSRATTPSSPVPMPYSPNQPLTPEEEYESSVHIKKSTDSSQEPDVEARGYLFFHI